MSQHWHSSTQADALQVQGTYRPRFKLDPRVIRIPIVPGSDPRLAYGDLASRGVKGIVLEAFGVGNMPDTADAGWLPWLREQRSLGLQVWHTLMESLLKVVPALEHSGVSVSASGDLEMVAAVCQGGCVLSAQPS